MQRQADSTCPTQKRAPYGKNRLFFTSISLFSHIVHHSRRVVIAEVNIVEADETGRRAELEDEEDDDETGADDELGHLK